MIFETILATLFVFMLGVIFYLLYHSKRKNDKEKDLSAILEAHGTLTLENKKLLYEINEEIYEIIFFYVPFNGELTINSKTMWEVRTGYQTRLINQKTQLSSSYKKIVVIYPTQQRLKRYINENELVFIHYTDFFYNMYVLSADDLEKLIVEVL
jgi:hypothetical protein